MKIYQLSSGDYVITGAADIADGLMFGSTYRISVMGTGFVTITSTTLDIDMTTATEMHLVPVAKEGQ